MDKKRYLTLNCVVRKHQIEMTRTHFEGDDENVITHRRDRE